MNLRKTQKLETLKNCRIQNLKFFKFNKKIIFFFNKKKIQLIINVREFNVTVEIHFTFQLLFWFGIFYLNRFIKWIWGFAFQIKSLETNLRFMLGAGISNAVAFGTCIWVGCDCTWFVDCCFCCSWLWVGMTTLSVSESRLELLAVDVAVPGLSRPPELLVALSSCWLLIIEFCCN